MPLLSRSGFHLAALALAASSAGCGGAPSTSPLPPALSPAQSKIEHVVIIVQENHTFDNHFGRYCTAAAGTNPACTDGPACCEAAPATEPGGAAPVVLDDAEAGSVDPDHSQACELAEMNGGKMDHYVTGTACASPHHFAVAPQSVVGPLWELAAGGALADRYFQPIIGQSVSNDLYLARAKMVFIDNAFGPGGPAQRCSTVPKVMTYTDTTIFDLLVGAGATFGWYSEGYKTMLDALTQNDFCPDPPDECPAHYPFYPCSYEGSDVPFAYYPGFRDNPLYMHDYSAFATDLAAGRLPQITFLKAIGYRSEHPGYHDTISAGVAFTRGVVDLVEHSSAASSTLLLLTYDEGGGYFDHVSPPPTSPVDNQAYGTRVPLVAIGPFARKNHVSHAVLEHSSIVKFLEWNWLGGKTGQLGTRDATVGNLGSLLDPVATGTAVPE